MKQFDVEIMGQPYVLGCPAGGEHRLHAAVAQVDETMNRIRDAGKVRARDRIAVLAALNLALELVDRDDRAAELPAPIEPARSGPDAAALQDAARLEALLQRLDDALAMETAAAPTAAQSPDDAPAASAPPAFAPQPQPQVAGADADTASPRDGDGASADDDHRPAVAQQAAPLATDLPSPSVAVPSADTAPAPAESGDHASTEDSVQNPERPAGALHG